MEDVSNKQPEESEPLFREYANNVYFDPTAWDMSITFGQLGTRLPNVERPEVEWKSTITLPWQQAKLAAYYFCVNVIFHEYDNGVVPIPERLIPKFPTPPDNADEALRNGYEELRRIHVAMFGSQSE